MDERAEIKAHLASISMYFWGWAAGAGWNKSPAFVKQFLEWIVQDAKTLDDMINGRKLILHLNDVWLSNTPTDNDDPEKRKMQENICMGIEYAICAVEEALGITKEEKKP